MMPYDTGSPSRPARTDEGALPPVPTQIGRRPCTGRGTTSSPSRAERTEPDQVTGEPRLIVVSRSSFSSKRRS